MRFISGFVCGAVLAAMVGVASAQVYVSVNTNGILKGYLVQKDGRIICQDPGVWHRSEWNYIICPD